LDEDEAADMRRDDSENIEGSNAAAGIAEWRASEWDGNG